MNSIYQLLEIQSHTQSISFEKNHLKNCDHQNRFNKILRYQDHDRSVNINGEQESTLDSMIDKARLLVPHGQSIDYEIRQDLDPRPFSFATNSYLDSLDLNSMISMGQIVVEKVTNTFNDLACDIKISKLTRNVSLQTSAGKEYKFPLHDFSLSSLVTGCDEDDILFFASGLNQPIKNLDPIDKFSNELIWHLDLTKNLVEIQSGKYPVIFHPQLVQQSLFEVINTGFNPVHLENGSSPLLNKIGDKILNASIHLSQSGTHFPLDFNGYSTESCSIVKAGVLNYVPIAPQISKALNQPITGSNFNGSWFPDLKLHSGTKNFKELIKEVDHGIYLVMSGDLVMGNILQGDMSGTIQAGFLIENGEIKGRVKNRSLGFNFYEALGDRLLGLSQESIRFGGSHFTESPYVLVDDIRIS